MTFTVVKSILFTTSASAPRWICLETMVRERARVLRRRDPKPLRQICHGQPARRAHFPNLSNSLLLCPRAMNRGLLNH
jgi:hypothetical protein